MQHFNADEVSFRKEKAPQAGLRKTFSLKASISRNVRTLSTLRSGANPRSPRMTRFVIAAALATAIAAPAFAQTATTEYYVVQDTTTKRCTIVDKKPTTTTVVQVGPAMFKNSHRSRNWNEDHQSLRDKVNHLPEVNYCGQSSNGLSVNHGPRSSVGDRPNRHSNFQSIDFVRATESKGRHLSVTAFVLGQCFSALCDHRRRSLTLTDKAAG